MPENQSNASEKKRNSFRRRITRKKLPAAKTQQDYPSFAQPPSPNPLIKTPKHILNNQGMALRRLGLKEADIADVPDVTPTVVKALGSVMEAVTLLAADDAPDSRKFVRKWNSMNEADRKHVKLEYVITAAGLTTRRFMELIAGAEFDNSGMVEKLFASRSRLKVMESTVKAATEGSPIFSSEGELLGYSGGDVKAMEIFHKITGALPTPKGSNFILNQQINTAKTIEAEPKHPLQAMDAFLLEIDDVRKPKQLAAPAEIPVEMPDNAPEVEYLDVSNLGEGV